MKEFKFEIKIFPGIFKIRMQGFDIVEKYCPPFKNLIYWAPNTFESAPKTVHNKMPLQTMISYPQMKMMWLKTSIHRCLVGN